MIAYLPFSGFYYTVHDDNLTRDLERDTEEMSHRAGRTVYDYLWTHGDYGSARLLYVQRYLDAFVDAVKTESPIEIAPKFTR